MGKPNKTAAWFQAVKKAFRSPSKEKSDNKDETKIHTSEKFGSSVTASTMALLQEPAPLPLPSFGKMGLDEGQQQEGRSHKKEPVNAAVVEPTAMDALVIVDNSAQEKKQKWGSPPLAAAAAAAAGDAESITNWSIIKQPASELLLNQEQYRSPSADSTKTEQAFLRSSLALKGLVRLQALVRGHRVRRQAGTTLRAVEALVRVQALIRGRRVRMSKEGQAVQYKLRQHQQIDSSANEDVSEECWDAILEDGAWKHERIVAHAPLSQQLKHTILNPKSLFMDCESDQQRGVWSWLERWTAVRPWENHYLEDQKETCCRTVSPSVKFSDSGTKLEYESGGMTRAPKKDTENLQAGALNSQIRTRKTPVQESLFKSIPFPLPTPPCATDPLSVPKSTPAFADVVHPPLAVYNQVDSQLLEQSTPEGPLPPLKGLADSPPLRLPSSPPPLDESMPVPMSPPACMNSLPFSPTVAPSPLQVQLPPDAPGVSSVKAEEAEEEENEEEEEEGEEEVNGLTNAGETNGLMCLESCNMLPGKHGYEQHEQHNGSTGSKMNVKLTSAGNRKSEMNDKAVGEENGENAVPISFKNSSTTTTSRYMTATESAKAKFRSLSNPKSRNADEMELRAKLPHRRLSQGGAGGGSGAQLGKSNSQSSTSRNQHNNPFQTHTSTKGRIWIEKTEGETGTESPRRRESYGGGETKRWR